MAYEIPVTQARAELADLTNRVVYGGERVVLTRHGKPLAALVSADDLRRLEELERRAQAAEAAGEQVGVSTAAGIRGTRPLPAHKTPSASPRGPGDPGPPDTRFPAG